jgi:hypothetical protein
MMRMMFVVTLCAASLGCGKSTSSGASDTRAKWLAAKLVPTEREHKGVKIRLDVPEGLPENKESMVGPDWREPGLAAGPRISVGVRQHEYKTPEDLARDVEPDPKRLDLQEVGATALPGGKLQYVSATNGARHLDVSVWIPIDETRGVQASCHWYAGSGAADSKTPDAELVAWLTKICDTVRVQ